MLAVSVAAPVTMMLLAASDQLSGIVSAAAGNAGTHFLKAAGLFAGGLTLVARSPFLAFAVGLLTVGGAVALWIELLMREAAVYVIVLMLPLAFSALVWPARRVWALRAVEVLMALILAKFAIVAVLSLGGTALSASAGTLTVTGLLAGVVLLVMGAFTPWALLRLLPLAELASGAAGSLRGGGRTVASTVHGVDMAADWGKDWATTATMQMRDQLRSAAAPDAGPNGARADASATPGVGERPDLFPAQKPTDQGSAAPKTEHETAGSSQPLLDGEPSTQAPLDGEPSSRPSERLPGMGAMWQAPDMSWRPLTLGLEEGWPPPALWPRGGHTPQARTPATQTPVNAGGDGGAADEHDAVPSPQEPGGGL